jgi:hypothetical protein
MDLTSKNQILQLMNLFYLKITLCSLKTYINHQKV